MIRCLQQSKHSWSKRDGADSVAVGHVCYLADGGGGEDELKPVLNSAREAQEGTPGHRTISQRAGVVNPSPWETVAHP